MEYFWFKAFHIIGFVVWFAGLFYLPRLFVYHAEAREQPEQTRQVLHSQFQIMEKRLYTIITTPGMIVTLAMGIGMVTLNPALLQENWLHIKLTAVVLLIGYHHYCGRLIKQLAQGTCTWTGQNFRVFNEIPTVFFVGVVLLAVFKDQLPLDWATGAVALMILLMAVAIQLYAKKRRQDKEKLQASQE